MAAATIVFTVHNRKALLLEAVALAKRQTVPVEIIVMDDASTDGLDEALAQAHPDVRHVRSDTARGPGYQRNRGVELAGCDIVFPLDDDSLLVSPRTIEQTLRQFDDPDVVLVGMPFKNVLQSDVVLQQRPDSAVREPMSSFVACAHAVRRAPFLAIGGFTEDYFYMGEEGDLSIRLLAAGIITEAGVADPIHHMQPPARRSYRADFYGRRNDVLFYYLRAPAPVLPVRIGGTVAKGLVFGLRNECLKAAMDGLRDGFRVARSGRLHRAPVPRGAFAAFQRMKRGERFSVPELRRLIAR